MGDAVGVSVGEGVNVAVGSAGVEVREVVAVGSFVGVLVGEGVAVDVFVAVLVGFGVSEGRVVGVKDGV